MNIKDELEYVSGQIAHKVIAKNDSGMVILMAFDKDAALATPARSKMLPTKLNA